MNLLTQFKKKYDKYKIFFLLLNQYVTTKSWDEPTQDKMYGNINDVKEITSNNNELDGELIIKTINNNKYLITDHKLLTTEKELNQFYQNNEANAKSQHIALFQLQNIN